MIKLIRFIGSTAFVLGGFTLVFIGFPYIVTIANDPNIGGPLPIWFKIAVYSLLGGIIVVLLSIGLETFMMKSKGDLLDIPEDACDLIVENTGAIPSRKVAQVLGLVQGQTIYAIWIGQDISALLRLILGGELTEYTEMMSKARALAMHRMKEKAKELGADAIVGVRMTTTSVVGTAAELLTYGTAVKLEPQ